MKQLCLLLALTCVFALCACPSSSRMPFQKGMALMQARDYGTALIKFEESLAADPTQKRPLYYKARCLYELDRFEEALEAFEKFLADTTKERSKFRDERFDAEFYRDKSKQELGIEVPQDPDAIPEERMR